MWQSGRRFPSYLISCHPPGNLVINQAVKMPFSIEFRDPNAKKATIVERAKANENTNIRAGTQPLNGRVFQSRSRSQQPSTIIEAVRYTVSTNIHQGNDMCTQAGKPITPLYDCHSSLSVNSEKHLCVSHGQLPFSSSFFPRKVDQMAPPRALDPGPSHVCVLCHRSLCSSK